MGCVAPIDIKTLDSNRHMTKCFRILLCTEVCLRNLHWNNSTNCMLTTKGNLSRKSRYGARNQFQEQSLELSSQAA
jgi:hypothetical protein